MDTIHAAPRCSVWPEYVEHKSSVDVVPSNLRAFIIQKALVKHLTHFTNCLLIELIRISGFLQLVSN